MAKKTAVEQDNCEVGTSRNTLIMMECTYAGPLGCADTGDICDISGKLAKELVDSMNARYITLKQDGNVLFAYEGSVKLKRVHSIRKLNGSDECSNRVKEGI